MSLKLEGVKVGDKLKVMHQWGQQYEGYTVERVTKTRAVCNRNTSFKIDDGLMIGTGGFRTRSYASFLTPEDIAAAELDRRIKTAHNEIRCMRVTADNLEAAEAFIAASNKESEAAK